MGDAIDDLNKFLDTEWDPDLTVGDWWEKLGTAGWSAPSLPEHAYGKGLGRNDAGRVAQRIGEYGALPAPGGLGLLLAAPTIATHGTPEQIEQFVRPIVTGQQSWCQLFSEPGAGSDLAGLGCKAELDGEEWIINGQKVWTSGGQIADMGMLIARTDVEVPKHQGITWFSFDMHQGDKVEVRPLREMTGRALFNEVFINDARVPDANIIGGKNHGWAVANTTLMFERAGLGSGGHGATSAANAGTIAGDLTKRAGDFVRQRTDGGGDPVGLLGGAGRMLIELAKSNGTAKDPSIRQQLMKLHTLTEIGRFSNLRLKAAKAAGQDIPGLPNISKLSMSEIVRQSRDIGLAIVGAYGTLHAYDAADRKALDAATGNPFLGMVTETALFAQAPPIYGGTDQVQRNIIGERVLGLPKEPNNDKTLSYREMPKNG
ncbi:MAG: acyl-CoA dehydrogenase family protein [Acidimicrobiales bacterium]